MSKLRLFLSLCILVGSVLLSQHTVSAQFGINKKQADEGAPKQEEATVGADGEVEISKEVQDLASKLMGINEKLAEQDAKNIASLIDAAKRDKETKMMLHQMKTDQKEAFDETASSPQSVIVEQLANAFDEIIMADILFQDRDKALEKMEEEGMIDKKKLPEYKKNPELLEEDTRRGLYFLFVTLAEAGGFMELV